MKLVLLFLLVNCISGGAFSQYLILSDSLEVDFQRDHHEVRIVNSQDDLNYRIIITNTSKKTVQSYTELSYDDTTSPFANYYLELRKKTGSDYVILPISHRTCGGDYVLDELYQKYDDQRKVDSAFAVYDFPKKRLIASSI